MSMQARLCAARPQPGCADVHREPLQRRGLHAAGVREPDAGHAGRGVGGRPRRREHLGGQDGEVPRPVHEVGRVPARDHQPPHQGAGRRDSGPRRARQSHPDEAGVRHRHHASHQPAGAAERVLLEARQRASTRSPRASPATMGTSGSSAPEHTWVAASASTAAPARRRRSTVAKGLKPTPTRSSTPTTSRLGWPSCLEAICSST
jgi:hypothetical protein